MPLTVDPASIRIDFSTDLAKPDIDLTVDPVICNLTSSYSKGGGGVVGPAWNAFAQATVSGSDPAGDVDFGFIQFCQQGGVIVQYSGAKKPLGSIALAPTVANSTLLDSDGARNIRPWTAGAPRFKLQNSQMTCQTGDHPAARLGLKLTNRRTGADNFLQFISDTREFWTVLTKKDKSATPQNEYLAHFTWHLKYGFEFKWRSGKPIVVTRFSQLKFDKTLVKGAPTDPDVVKLLDEKNQGGPDYNQVADRSMKDSVNAQPPIRRDEPEWFLSTPQDFFK